MKDLSANPIPQASDVAAGYARLDSSYAPGEIFVTQVYGQQDLALQKSGGADFTGPSSDGTNTGQMKLFNAPFALKLTNCWFSFFAINPGSSLALNNTNYLVFSLGKTAVISGTGGTIVQGTTQASGDNAFSAALTANVPYALNTFPWDQGLATFATGDIAQFQVQSNGAAPATPWGLLCVTVTYIPV